MYKKPRWNIKRYASNWLAQSLACRNNANDCCEVCGIVRGTKLISKRGNTYICYPSASHLNMFDEMNSNAQLVYMCISCHACYDSAYHNSQKAIKNRAMQMKLQLFTDKSYQELEQEYKQQLKNRLVTRSMFFESNFYLSRQESRVA